MIKKIHSSHLGIEKTQQRARDIIFWPGMTAEIHEAVTICSICSPKVPSNPKQPLMSHEVPSRPWQKLASDLFSWDGKNFLVTVDYYSRYFEVDELSSTSSSAVIRKLSTHFARYGIPETLITNNGPQFAAQEFKNFAAAWDFRHRTSSPGYPQSNGLAERTVQTVKNILTKAKANGSSALFGILEYRATPVDNLASPAQLLMGRQPRSILPATNHQLRPTTIKPAVVVDRRKQLQATQKKYYNKNARDLPAVKANDKIFFQFRKGEDWKPAVVTSQDPLIPRSVNIQTEDGTQYRRNRRFIRRRQSPAPEQAAPSTPVMASRQNNTGSVPPAMNNPTTAPPDDQPTYVTRHGRTVKQPQKMDL